MENKDRRTTPHYCINLDATLGIRHNHQESNFPISIIDISFFGARITSAIILPDSSLATLSFKINNKLIVTSVHIELLNIQNKIYYYSIIFYGPEKIDGFNVFLDNLKMKPNRRESQRRHRQDIILAGNKRSLERRHSKPFFLKCMRYNRMDKLIVNNHYFYLREISSGAGNKIIRNGREMLMFGSNNYLGLANHPEVKEAALKAVRKYGVGSGGVRVLSGTIDLHNQLEHTLADLKGGEDCIVYSSGYSTNVGIISSLVTKDDQIIIDAKAHASIVDGCLLSGNQFLVFKHNDMDDLEDVLKSTDQNKNKIIITDGVFSMDGDIAKLDRIYELGNKYSSAVMIDDAHSTGVIGYSGRGTASHFNLEGKIDLTIGTLSKALGGVGGFAVANKRIIHYLKHTSRAFVFSTSLPPAISAAVLKAIEIINTQPELHAQLSTNIKYTITGLKALGLNIGLTESAIIPIILKNEKLVYKLTGILENEGIFVSPVAYPAVRKKESRIRISVMATHTKDDLNFLLDTLGRVSKQLHIT